MIFQKNGLEEQAINIYKIVGSQFIPFWVFLCCLVISILEVNNKNAAMLFYDKKEKIQVRLKVECTINHENEITKHGLQ